jgi:hypothetical protein
VMACGHGQWAGQTGLTQKRENACILRLFSSSNLKQ